VDADRLAPLPDHLALKTGAPLTQESLQESLRQIYSTGLFDNVQVEGSQESGGVDIVFRGQPRSFIGLVTVDGAKGATINTQLERASQLVTGTQFTRGKLTRALDQMHRTLADNGFNQPKITQETHEHPEDRLIDISFHVVSGPQARVGAVAVSGDSGLNTEEFRHSAHLKPGSRVDRDTDNRAIDGVLKHYQKRERLEAEIKLDSQQYDAAANRTSFKFTANRGPTVKVLVEGASLGSERIKRLIPVFEEASVDDDLLNEGNRRLRDYYQRQGYFDVKVEHRQQSATADRVVIVYSVHLGSRQRVGKVTVVGNRYFDAATLEQLLTVHGANALDRHGIYSQALVATDVSAIESVYENNGFSKAKVTPETNPGTAAQHSAGDGSIPLILVYRVDEGPQQRVGTVRIEGAEHVDIAKLTPLLNTAPGQLLSPQNLAGDRDALLTDFGWT
jgi:outer membrane protein insertion porin family